MMESASRTDCKLKSSLLQRICQRIQTILDRAVQLTAGQFQQDAAHTGRIHTAAQFHGLAQGSLQLLQQLVPQGLAVGGLSLAQVGAEFFSTMGDGNFAVIRRCDFTDNFTFARWQTTAV